MFEKEVKFICDFCLNKVNKAGAVLTFEKLKDLEIHPAILKYISAEIDYQIFKDRQILLEKSSFDYSGSEISKYFKMIAYEIKKSKRITESEIIELINKAVVFNFEFTTKPNETLTNLIFENSDRKSPDDLVMVLDHIYYYGYLRDVLVSYLDKKQLLTIEKSEFEFLLDKVDSELFKVKTNELVNNALDAIADIFNIGAVLRSQIPGQAIDMFLKEKKLIEYQGKLEKAIGQNPKTKYEIDEIKKIIYSTIDFEEKKAEISKDTPANYDEATSEEPITSVSANLASEVKNESSEDLNEKTNKSEVEKVKNEDFEIVSDNSEKPIDLSEEITIEEEVETFPISSDAAEEQTSKHLLSEESNRKSGQDIISFLSKKEIEKIISSIFNDDKDDFATTIEIISECKSYEKATEILRSLYTTYNVNPYSRDAILLTNAVAKYFTVT